MKYETLLRKILPGRFLVRRPVISVLSLRGVIGMQMSARRGLSMARLAPVIEAAFRPRHLSAVALIVNSPGGSPVQSALIAKRVRDLADEKGVPVLAFVEDVAASGGYWLAVAADEIYADQSSVIGSIGVISAGFGFSDLIAKLGVERRIHTSGERKSLLDPFRPEDPADVQRLKNVQGEIHEAFKAQVRLRRGTRLRASEESLFSGEFWTGARAMELGLIDGIGDLRQVLRARFGKKLRLRGYAPRPSLFGGRLPFLGKGGEPANSGFSPRDWSGDLISAVEERAYWSRFGL